MKKLIYLVALIISINGYSQKGQTPPTSQTITVDAALEKVKEATKELTNTGYFNGTFDVSVKFNDVVADENNLEFKIWFISFKKGKNKSIDNSYTAKYQFKTTKRKQSKPLIFNNNLAEVLRSGIKAYENVDPEYMKRNGFEIVSSFTLEEPTEGGIEVEISPISVGASKKRTRKSIHTITLTFTPKKEEKPVEEKDILKKSEEVIAKSNELLKASKALLEQYKGQ